MTNPNDKPIRGTRLVDRVSKAQAEKSRVYFLFQCPKCQTVRFKERMPSFRPRCTSCPGAKTLTPHLTFLKVVV